MLFLSTSLFSLSVVTQLTHWYTNSEWSHVDVVLQFLIFFERHHFLLNVKSGYLIFCDQCKCKHNKLSKKESWFFFTCSAYLNNRNYRGNFLEILALSPNLRVKFSSLVSILRLDKSVLDINNFDFKMSPLKQRSGHK